jgi:hypothetical protein
VAATPVPPAVCQPPPPATPRPSPTPDVALAPTPTPAPDLEAIVDPLLETFVATAAANLQACWNAADWPAVANSVTPRFLQTAYGIAPDAGAAQALATLDLGPLTIENISPMTLWSDGRGAVEVLYLRGEGSPAQAVAARWFVIAERGVARFDEETLLLPPLLGDRATIGFAIADDQQPMQWSGFSTGQVPASPVIALHAANRGRRAHTFLLDDPSGRTLGLLTLPPWTQGDLLLLDLPPGAYRLHDPTVPGSQLDVRVIGG